MLIVARITNAGARHQAWVKAGRPVSRVPWEADR